ncbi:MAG: hypothetical protein O7E52_10990 [Candidatus Poribacteria bacterium]|nr:hypothetical protein [Candidatus Poribacteria bacterium]
MRQSNSGPTIEQIRRREKVNGWIIKSAVVIATAVITFFVLSVIS